MNAPPFTAASAAPYTSRDRADLHPVLRERFEALEIRWAARFVFRKLRITRTYSNANAQTILWRQGRTTPGKIVTNCDGRVSKSQHNFYPSRAVDVCVLLLSGEPEIIKPAVTWNVVLYRPLLALAGEVGLVSGGGWRMKDWPHLQLPPEVL